MMRHGAALKGGGRDMDEGEEIMRAAAAIKREVCREDHHRCTNFDYCEPLHELAVELAKLRLRQRAERGE